MHDHVVSYIKELPSIKLEYVKLGNVWRFIGDNNYLKEIKPPSDDVMPEWNGMYKEWYWVMIPT